MTRIVLCGALPLVARRAGINCGRFGRLLRTEFVRVGSQTRIRAARGGHRSRARHI